MTFVEDLQQDIEHVGVCFLDFVEQHDGIWFSAYFLRQLTAFFVSDVSRRCSYQTRNGEFFHIFAHVYAD